jgi:hypothetical protein
MRLLGCGYEKQQGDPWGEPVQGVQFESFSESLPPTDGCCKNLAPA